jgi:hypothetical protein
VEYRSARRTPRPLRAHRSGQHPSGRPRGPHIATFSDGPWDLALFFAELAADWRGWEGERHWRALEGELEVQASQKDARVLIAVTVKHPDMTFANDAWGPALSSRSNPASNSTARRAIWHRRLPAIRPTLARAAPCHRHVPSRHSSYTGRWPATELARATIVAGHRSVSHPVAPGILDSHHPPDLAGNRR